MPTTIHHPVPFFLAIGIWLVTVLMAYQAGRERKQIAWAMVGIVAILCITGVYLVFVSVS